MGNSAISRARRERILPLADEGAQQLDILVVTAVTTSVASWLWLRLVLLSSDAGVHLLMLLLALLN